MSARPWTVKVFTLGQEPKESAEWLTRSSEERILEVFRLRAIWGADQQPMQRVVAEIRPLKPNRPSAEGLSQARCDR